MRRYSMTRRVVSLVLLIELLFAVSTTTLAFFYERHEYFEALDIALRGHADSLMGAVVEAADDSERADYLVRAGRGVQKLGPKFVILKKGEHGAMLFGEDNLLVMPAYPTADVIDPTGAGDTFFQ